MSFINILQVFKSCWVGEKKNCEYKYFLDFCNELFYLQKIASFSED